MISRININSFKPAFGVVSRSAAKRALEYGKINQDYYASLIINSKINAPDFVVEYQPFFSFLLERDVYQVRKRKSFLGAIYNSLTFVAACTAAESLQKAKGVVHKRINEVHEEPVIKDHRDISAKHIDIMDKYCK